MEALVQSEKGRSVINEGNSSGRTPLHYAVLSGRKNCVEALLIVGADRFIKDGSGCNSIEISQREVADKEEREARAIAKGLVQTEGLQPARDTLQLLLHWDPNKAGRLFKMKMMAGEISSPAAGRKSSMGGLGKLVDLKAAAGLTATTPEVPKEAAPAKAAKLNMLKKMSSANMSPSRTLGAEAEAIKEENKLAEQSAQLKDWEIKAKALKDRIEERERTEQAEKEAREAREAEEAAARKAEEEAARLKEETEAAERAAREAEEAAKAAAKAAEDDPEIKLRLASDVQWTNSPALGRRKAPQPRKGADSDDEGFDDDGIRVWQAPNAADEAALKAKKIGFMPNPNLLERRRGSKILDDEERARFSKSLTGMIDLKNERAGSNDLPKMEASHLHETPEEAAARLKAQHEAEERVEQLRIKLMEERRQRNIQRHLDQADRFESQGKISDAIDEYRLALDEGPSELASRKIVELDAELKGEAARTMDFLASIEQAASMATEMSVGFSKLAGNMSTDKKKYGAIAAEAAADVNSEEFLKSIQKAQSGADDFDDAEFQATLDQTKVDTRETKAPTVTTATKKKSTSGEVLQINVDTATRSAPKVVDESDTWIAPLPQKGQKVEVEDDGKKEDDEAAASEQKRKDEAKKKKKEAKREKKRIEEEEKRRKEAEDEKKKNDEEKKKKKEAEEKEKKAKEDAKKAEEVAKKKADEEDAKKKAEDAKMAEEDAIKKADDAKKAGAKPEKKSADPANDATSPRDDGEEVFDKKAYNTHVRKAKQFAAENNLQKALEEYQAAGKQKQGKKKKKNKNKNIFLMCCFCCSGCSSEARRTQQENQVTQEKSFTRSKMKVLVFHFFYFWEKKGGKDV